MRIGWVGYAKSGKDCASDYLVAECGFVKVNMSDAMLRDMRILNPLIEVPEDSWTDWGPSVRLAVILKEYGYDDCKELFPDFRVLLQTYGTEVWRSVDREIWIKRAVTEASRHPNVTTTGIRFVNELRGIDYLIHVERPGVGPVNGHESDTGIGEVVKHAGFTIVNDGSVAELHEKVARVYHEILLDH